MDQVAQLFAQASRIFEPPTRHVLPEFNFQIAGRMVCLRFANERLAPLFSRAFHHLQVEANSSPDLVIWTWDLDTAGLASLNIEFPARSGGIFYYPGPRNFLCDGATHRIDAYDPVRRLGLLCIPEVDSLDSGYLTAPFLNIIHWWSHEQGLQLVHGGAVGTERGCALLVGRGVSGKSTTVLGCVGSDLLYIGDDYCLIEYGQEGAVHSLYSSGKADAGSLVLLPHLRPAFEHATTDPRGKSITYLAEHAPQSLLKRAPVRAIIVPQIGQSDLCAAFPISPAKALCALAPSTIFQLPGSRTRSLAQMAKAVRVVPCWKLVIGPDPQAANPLISKIINSGDMNFAI